MKWGARKRPPFTFPAVIILKPAVNDFDGFAANEHFCLTLARRIGLIAAVTEWRVTDLAMKLPDEAATLSRELGNQGGVAPVLAAIVDGIARQSASVMRHFKAPRT
jgi:hypothetical protein